MPLHVGLTFRAEVSETTHAEQEPHDRIYPRCRSVCGRSYSAGVSMPLSPQRLPSFTLRILVTCFLCFNHCLLYASPRRHFAQAICLNTCVAGPRGILIPQQPTVAKRTSTFNFLVGLQPQDKFEDVHRPDFRRKSCTTWRTRPSGKSRRLGATRKRWTASAQAEQGRTRAAAKDPKEEEGMRRRPQRGGHKRGQRQEN